MPVAGSRGHRAVRHGVRGVPGVPRRGGSGLSDQRRPGFTDPGSFAELVVVHAAGTNLVALPAGLDAAVAAGLGCRVATAYRAVVARAAVRDGDSVLVIGCGGVGLAAVAIARSRGAYVCAVDVSAGSLDRALFHGADEVVDASIGVDKVLAAVSRWSGGGGASVSIDALGSPEACRTGVLALRPTRAARAGGAAAASSRYGRTCRWSGSSAGTRRAGQPRHGGCRLRPLLDDVAGGQRPRRTCSPRSSRSGSRRRGAHSSPWSRPVDRDRARRPGTLSRHRAAGDGQVARQAPRSGGRAWRARSGRRLPRAVLAGIAPSPAR